MVDVIPHEVSQLKFGPDAYTAAELISRRRHGQFIKLRFLPAEETFLRDYCVYHGLSRDHLPGPDHLTDIIRQLWPGAAGRYAPLEEKLGRYVAGWVAELPGRGESGGAGGERRRRSSRARQQDVAELVRLFDHSLMRRSAESDEMGRGHAVALGATKGSGRGEPQLHHAHDGLPASSAFSIEAPSSSRASGEATASPTAPPRTFSSAQRSSSTPLSHHHHPPSPPPPRHKTQHQQQQQGAQLGQHPQEKQQEHHHPGLVEPHHAPLFPPPIRKTTTESAATRSTVPTLPTTTNSSTSIPTRHLPSIPLAAPSTPTPSTTTTTQPMIDMLSPPAPRHAHPASHPPSSSSTSLPRNPASHSQHTPTPTPTSIPHPSTASPLSALPFHPSPSLRTDLARLDRLLAHAGVAGRALAAVLDAVPGGAGGGGREEEEGDGAGDRLLERVDEAIRRTEEMLEEEEVSG